MRLTVWVSVFGLVAALTTPTFALADQAPSTPDATGTQATTPQPKAKHGKDPNEVICKREDDTGSHIGSHRTCLTRAQWEYQASENAQQFNDIRQRGDYTAPAPGMTGH